MVRSLIKRSKIRSVLKIALSYILVFLLVFTGLEIWFRKFNHPISGKTFRLSEPLPYRNTSYFSKDFIEESFMQPGGWITPPGTNLTLPKDFDGKYIHAKGGLRVTTGQPIYFNRRILVFGGSTIYCSEVPDNLTIPSLIQKKLIDCGYTNIAVFNYGTTAASSFQQLERLRGIKLHQGDIVIFYDGNNDVGQGVYRANPLKTIVADNRQRPVLIRMLAVLHTYSAFLNHIMVTMERNYAAEHLYDQKTLQKLVDKTVEIYLNNEIQAFKYCQKYGVEFIHFLQPTIFTLKKWTSYEKNLVAIGAPIILKGSELAFSVAYPKMRAALATNGIRFHNVDLSSAFDGLDYPVYLDGCHIADRGNEVIAEKIVEYLIVSNVLHSRTLENTD